MKNVENLDLIRDKKRAWNRAWNEKNPERKKEINRKSYVKCREKRRSYSRKYYSENKDFIKAKRDLLNDERRKATMQEM